MDGQIFSFSVQKTEKFSRRQSLHHGTCYAAMEENGATACKDTLYLSDDMIQHNLGMWMEIRGQEGYYPLVNAGINWYMARHTCEFLLGDEKEVVIYSRTVRGEEMEHTLALVQLPDRPRRATRLRLDISFTAPDRCRVRAEDLGLGELYPSSGKIWEANISLS